MKDPSQMNTSVLDLLLTDIALAITGAVLRHRMEGRIQHGLTTGFLVCAAAPGPRATVLRGGGCLPADPVEIPRG